MSEVTLISSSSLNMTIIGRSFDVKVLKVHRPNHLLVKHRDVDKNFSKVYAEIQCYVQTDAKYSSPNTNPPMKGDIVLIQDSQEWCRALVCCGPKETERISIVECQYLDNDKRSIVKMPISETYQCPEQFGIGHVPPLYLDCFVDNIRPLVTDDGQYKQSDQWTDMADHIARNLLKTSNTKGVARNVRLKVLHMASGLWTVDVMLDIDGETWNYSELLWLSRLADKGMHTADVSSRTCDVNDANRKTGSVIYTPIYSGELLPEDVKAWFHDNRCRVEYEKQ